MRKRLSRSLLYYDIIALLFIFISVFIVFESVIKKMFVSYGEERFLNHVETAQFDLSTGINSLEEKGTLDYKLFTDECFNYLKMSYLRKAKYDESIIMFIFPNNTIYGGSKTDPDKISAQGVYYDKFLKSSESKSNGLFQFKLDGKKYIGLVELSRTGIRKEMKRENKEVLYPIIVIAEKESDFFFIIDVTRGFFIIWLFIIMLIIGVFKVRLTTKAASEIKKISDMLKEESENIRKRGLIGEVLKALPSDFVEVNDLTVSSLDLNNSLIKLRNVVKGVTTEEFLIGTITGDKNITEQHEIHCSVMFVDIKGFTTISEKHNKHSMKIGIKIFSAVGEILKKYGGEIRKLLGDAALITFKERDINNKRSALNSVTAALEILSCVPQLKADLNKEYNPENKKELEIDFNFRIGVDSGVVNEGLYGTPDNFEYGIIGDPVNTASRFEGLNKQYYTNILINDNTFNEISSTINCFANKPVNELNNSSFYILDEARTKGKKTSSKIFTVYTGDSDNRRFAGWDSNIKSTAFEAFVELHKQFTDSIKLWKKYRIDGEKEFYKQASEVWYKLITQFAALDKDYNFKPVRQYIKLMLKMDDYHQFETDYDTFVKRSEYDLNIPDDDWLTDKCLSRELDK